MTSRILISLAIAAVLLWGCEGARASRESSSQTPVRPVKTITLTSNTAPIPIEASGKVASGKEMHLAFKIGGVIERLSVSEGQQVRQGQVLGTLNLTEINARVAQAQNAMDKAERDLQRLQKLYGDSVITLEQLQDATTGAEVARAELEVATFNRQYARLVAPADGKVLRKFRESGELVSPGAPVLQLGTSDRAARIMRIGISDRDVVRLALGDTARLTFDAFPGQHFRA
ncbi:MAG TPA: efflux RND transporter periplasmic adaptor subunit, partial [Calditrichia bacterium]|nr:efflux RND transporter periplasmic adaptor subunit [Calditrichia bacterium]